MFVRFFVAYKTDVSRTQARVNLFCLTVVHCIVMRILSLYLGFLVFVEEFDLTAWFVFYQIGPVLDKYRSQSHLCATSRIGQ